MRRSQPVSNDERILKKLGLPLNPREELPASREVVKVEVVDEMFDFQWKPTVKWYVLWPFRHVRLWFRNTKYAKKAYRVFRKQLVEYYPRSINAFLPLFVRHLELYIALEKQGGISTQECKEYKIATAQEAVDIINRLVADDYSSVYTDAIEAKWGKFPYEKITYADGSTCYKHLSPDEYDAERRIAYDNAHADEERDLKRLGELIEKNMLDWWD
jgi:hypothetical protein